MKSAIPAFALLALLIPAALPAQPAALADEEKVVATVNGEAITRAEFDQAWSHLNEKLRAQYEQAGGGRAGFLETLVQKHLLLQEAAAKGYDKWPAVTAKDPAAREDALFDLYVREVIEPRVVNDEAARAYYDKNIARFQRPELVKLRLIAVSTDRRMPQEARSILEKVSGQLFGLKGKAAQTGDTSALLKAFSDAAEAVSEHPSAAKGGDLGWVEPDKLEAKLADAARKVPERMISGILQVPNGYAMVYVEGRKPAGLIEFSAARDAILTHLRAQLGPNVVMEATAHARDLRAKADVKVLEENLR